MSSRFKRFTLLSSGRDIWIDPDTIGAVTKEYSTHSGHFTCLTSAYVKDGWHVRESVEECLEILDTCECGD